MIRLCLTAHHFVKGALLTLSAAQAHYLNHVMRLNKGDILQVFNGRDGLWIATVGHKATNVILEDCVTPQPEPNKRIHLFFSPIKRLSFLLEKATELGATHLYPCLCRHSVVRTFSKERAMRTIEEACEQSQRLTIPFVAPLRPLAHHLADYAGILWVCSPEGAPFDMAASQGEDLGFLIGPEGGLHTEETQGFTKSQLLSLAPTVLRAETAAAAALTLGHLSPTQKS